MAGQGGTKENPGAGPNYFMETRGFTSAEYTSISVSTESDR